jgi:prepilin-type processing-associated H-X9-DG protein
MGGTPSSLWGHGSQGNTSDNGPNCLPASGGDQMINCATVQNQFVGGSAGMINVGVPCQLGSPDANQAQTSRSAHLGGIQAAFCDGSVHFISNYIQVGPIMPATNSMSASIYGVWDLLNLSNDSQAVPAGSY